jgi:hypothetical protein
LFCRQYNLLSGESITADLYVSAVPVDIFKKLLPAPWYQQQFFSKLDKLVGVPVINIHIWFDRKLTTGAHHFNTQTRMHCSLCCLALLALLCHTVLYAPTCAWAYTTHAAGCRCAVWGRCLLLAAGAQPPFCCASPTDHNFSPVPASLLARSHPCLHFSALTPHPSTLPPAAPVAHQVLYPYPLLYVYADI